MRFACWRVTLISIHPGQVRFIQISKVAKLKKVIQQSVLRINNTDYKTKLKYTLLPYAAKVIC